MKKEIKKWDLIWCSDISQKDAEDNFNWLDWEVTNKYIWKSLEWDFIYEAVDGDIYICDFISNKKNNKIYNWWRVE